VARAKGLREKAVLYRHAIKNALNPVVTAIGIQFGRLMGGAVVTETVFAWPGVGRLAIEAVYYRDMPIVQASVLFLTVVIVLSNLAADVANGLLDPRIRHA